MKMRFSLPVLATVATVVAVAALAGAQGSLQTALTPRAVAAPKNMKWDQKHETLNFNTNIGSFKLLGVNEFPVEGTLDISFKGTVLISNLDPGSTLVVSGNVRKEIDDKKLGKQVFFGNGRMTIFGKFRAVQFFGQNLRGRFDGFGFIRMYGEFDRNLETGFFWFDGDTEKQAWSNNGIGFGIPRQSRPQPRVTIEGKG